MKPGQTFMFLLVMVAFWGWVWPEGAVVSSGTGQ
nr:hypothetical protein [Marinobacter algicola]